MFNLQTQLHLTYKNTQTVACRRLLLLKHAPLKFPKFDNLLMEFSSVNFCFIYATHLLWNQIINKKLQRGKNDIVHYKIGIPNDKKGLVTNYYLNKSYLI